MELDKNLFHNDSLQLFNDMMFSGILDVSNVVPKKKAITLDKEKFYGYFLEKDKNMYFVEDATKDNTPILDKLPIRIKKKTEEDYNKNVFWFIDDWKSVKIPDDRALTLRKLVNTIADFKHTNPLHWKLYKIINVTAWCDRINYRVIGELGFGKDSILGTMTDLVGDLANIYGATFAKLEYSLKHKLLVFNEMGNLKPDDKTNMQQFLLAIGAFSNTYIKRSRATDDTLEKYNISKQSLGIIYNPPMYYVERGQEYFDIMFTKPVANRFIPFYLEGKLDKKFDAQFDVKKVVTENLQIYKDCISTLRYYRKTTVTNKYLIPDDVIFDKKTRRFERSFLKICDYISEYSETEEEYYILVNALYQSYKKYVDKVVKEALMHNVK